jgi:hypothetical protein
VGMVPLGIIAQPGRLCRYAPARGRHPPVYGTRRMPVLFWRRRRFTEVEAPVHGAPGGPQTIES